MEPPFEHLKSGIQACQLCAVDFAQTVTAHQPRPVFWLSPTARILIAGQAPGAKVHESGMPFTDPSGDRLRNWMGVSEDQFFDRTKIAILPMAFCFPGYNARGADLPPPKRCAATWRQASLDLMPDVQLTLLIGGYAQKWHLGKAAANVTETVRRWQAFGPNVMPLPHPSWRNTGWLKKNAWFERDLLPVLQSRIKLLL